MTEELPSCGESTPTSVCSTSQPAKDADTDEDVVIWTPNVYSDKRVYYTMSKGSFCESVSIDGVRPLKFRRQTQMRISGSVADHFEEDGFPRPVRKPAAHTENEYDDWHRPSASSYHEYASYFEERFVKGMSIRKYAQAHGLNRGSVDHLQRKFFAAFAQALRKRDEADNRSRLQAK